MNLRCECFPKYTGDLYQEEQILNWLMTQKDPGGDVIEDIEGQRLIELIEESGSMAVYFCKFLFLMLFRFCSSSSHHCELDHCQQNRSIWVFPLAHTFLHFFFNFYFEILIIICCVSSY